MPPRKRVSYTPPEASTILDQTAAAMVRARIAHVHGRSAAAAWDREWQRYHRARQRALTYGTAMGRTDGRRGVPPVYDRATVDPVGVAYLAAYDQARGVMA